MKWLEYHEEPVTLHSGGRSHWLVRGDLIYDDAQMRGMVLDYWMDVLKTWTPPFEIAPVPTGGDVWVKALADVWKARFPDEHSTETPYRVIVDDVVTTGISIADPRAHIRLAVVDRRSRDRHLQPFVNAWATMHLPLLSED